MSRARGSCCAGVPTAASYVPFDVGRKNRSAGDLRHRYSDGVMNENRASAMNTALPGETEDERWMAVHGRTCRAHDDEAGTAARRAAVVVRACRMIETSETPPPLAELAAAAGMSPFHFHRLFKAETGLTPKAFGSGWRARRLRRELDRPDASITDAIYGSGFNSSSRFYEDADHLLGMPARDYRAGGSGAVIRFAVGQCSLGAILVAQSQRGICAILLGDDPDRLVRDLQDQFPRAELIGCDREFEQLIARVVGFIEAPSVGLHLPLDIQGTAFQERVWRALREIPPGTTATYTEIASRIGSPRAVRAVARACATNHIAVAIPCHRVVRRDGSLAGYRWGVSRKRELLRREAEG